MLLLRRAGRFLHCCLDGEDQSLAIEDVLELAAEDRAHADNTSRVPFDLQPRCRLLHRMAAQPDCAGPPSSCRIGFGQPSISVFTPAALAATGACSAVDRFASAPMVCVVRGETLTFT